MKNSDRYKDVLGSKGTLSKSDIEDYSTASSAEQNKIEQKLIDDPFATDAMEGWSDLNFDTSILKQSDQLLPKQKFPWNIAMGALVVGVCSVLLFQFISNDERTELLVKTDKTTKLNVNNTIVLESSDLILPDSIQNLTEIEPAKQMNAQEIKNDFVQMDLPEIEFTALLPLDLKEQTIKGELVVSKTVGNEIYFFDLKLLNYEDYRTNSVIQIDQLILTGTPANKENDQSEELESSWKKVDVPYEDYLKKSIRNFDKLNYKKALTRFQTILSTYPQDINANFYGGLCLFNFGEYKDAITHFKNCTKSHYSNFDEEAEWMIANSYLNMGDSVHGKKLMKIILENGKYYSTQASEKLK